MIFDDLGREEGCLRLSKAFYARVASNSELRPLFPGKNLRCATEEFAAFLVQFFGGDEARTQYRWWLGLRRSHARFRIGESRRIAWLEEMRSALDETVNAVEARRHLMDFFEGVSRYVTGAEMGEPQNPELAMLWARQLDLERFVLAVDEGRVDEAIGLSRGLLDRPSVVVGILDHLMRTQREAPLQFVLETIDRVPEVRFARFNGRTLLHFAAGSGSAEVVHRLLSKGVDPNVADSGGHTPLYRAASCLGPAAGEIVEALIAAGADVDRASATTRATPLHEAARRGNLYVAKALIRFGANPELRDKRGCTALERARRCRRLEFAEFLAALPRGYS